MYISIGPDYNRDCWLKEKFTLGLDFPNVTLTLFDIILI